MHTRHQATLLHRIQLLTRLACLWLTRVPLSLLRVCTLETVIIILRCLMLWAPAFQHSHSLTHCVCAAWPPFRRASRPPRPPRPPWPPRPTCDRHPCRSRDASTCAVWLPRSWHVPRRGSCGSRAGYARLNVAHCPDPPTLTSHCSCRRVRSQGGHHHHKHHKHHHKHHGLMGAPVAGGFTFAVMLRLRGAWCPQATCLGITTTSTRSTGNLNHVQYVTTAAFLCVRVRMRVVLSMVDDYCSSRETTCSRDARTQNGTHSETR